MFQHPAKKACLPSKSPQPSAVHLSILSHTPWARPNLGPTQDPGPLVMHMVINEKHNHAMWIMLALVPVLWHTDV